MKKLVIAALIQGASASATVLTGDNFDAEVLHPTRSAFVLFYAPWCGVPHGIITTLHAMHRQHRPHVPRCRRWQLLGGGRQHAAAVLQCRVP